MKELEEKVDDSIEVVEGAYVKFGSESKMPDELRKPALRKAIREKCMDCCCMQRAEVARCNIKKCSLWPYRMGGTSYVTE